MTRDPYPYVHVEVDGSARELTIDEIEYLEMKFHPTDGARPYIKPTYKALTPDGLIHGFLERRKLPRRIQKQLEKPKS